MSSNAEKFIDAFVAVEMYLKDYLNHPGVGFTQMVHMASKTNPIIRRHDGDLNEYAQLRNAIVHSRVGKNEIIAQPHDIVVETMVRIQNQLLRPKSVMDIIEKRPVYCAEITDAFANVLEMQSKHNYSVVPVYEKGRYAGILHMRLYQRFLEENRQDLIDLKTLTVKDILRYYESDDRVIFFDETVTLNDIVSRYDILNRKGRAIIAIIITRQGRLNQKPLGIITVADMPKIIRELE